MSLLFCGLHNDAAAIHVNRRALTILGDRELRTIVNFDGRAIAQAHNGMCVFRGANRVASAYLLPHSQRPNLRIGNRINRAISGLHCRFDRSERGIALNQRQGDQSQSNDQDRGNSPTQDNWLQAVIENFAWLLPHCGRYRYSRLACLLQSSAAGNAFMRMIEKQERARFGKFPLQVSRDQRLKIGATLYRQNGSSNFGFRHRFGRQLRPNAVGRVVHRCRIRLFCANAGSDLIQDVIEFFVLHNDSPE